MDNKVKEAIQTLVEALNSDEGYRLGWKSNIAMAFKDEYSRQAEERDYTDLGKLDIHEIANKAAESFLNLLCA